MKLAVLFLRDEAKSCYQVLLTIFKYRKHIAWEGICFRYFSGRRFKSHWGQLSIAASKIPSEMNTICINSFRYTHVITTTKIRLKQTRRLTKVIAETKYDTEKNDEIGVAGILMTHSLRIHDTVDTCLRHWLYNKKAHIRIFSFKTKRIVSRQYLLGETKIRSIVSARCTNTVTMFP